MEVNFRGRGLVSSCTIEAFVILKSSFMSYFFCTLFLTEGQVSGTRKKAAEAAGRPLTKIRIFLAIISSNKQIYKK